MVQNLSSVIEGGRDEDIALIEDNEHGTRVFTYGELRDWIARLAGGLRMRFEGRPFRVTILARNSADYVALYFAAMRAGGTIIPFNWRANTATVDFLIEDTRPDLLVTDDPRHTFPERIVIGSEEWRALAVADPVPPAPVGTEDIAQILYTSGSTGTPKGVPLSHAGQHWAVVEGARLIPDGATYRVLVAAPLFHMNALYNIKRSFHLGATVVLLPGFTPASYIRAIEIYRCDWITGVPTMIAMLLRHLGDRVPREFAGIRRIFIGSAPFGISLYEDILRLFPNAQMGNFYGTTEAGPLVYGPHPDGLPTPPLACGYPLFPEMVRLVDPDGHPVEGEGQGSLHMRTPANMRGYLNRPEVTERVLREGWYDSGDIIRRDENGFHFFVGRADDMLNCGGENIYPAEVEQVLDEHPDIVQVIVVPAPDAIKHEVPVAFVVPREGAAIEESAVKSWFIERAPAYLHPRRVFTLDEIPLAQTNKVDRSRLKSLALSFIDASREKAHDAAAHS